MTWPPTKPASGNSNADPQLDLHPALHNDTRAAIDDIEGEVNAVSAAAATAQGTADAANAAIAAVRDVFDDGSERVQRTVDVVNSANAVMGNIGVAPKMASDTNATQRTLSTSPQNTNLQVVTYDAPAANSLVILVGQFDFEVDGNCVAIGQLSTNGGSSFWAPQAVFRSVDSARCTVTKVWVGTNAASWTASLWVSRGANGSGTFFPEHSSLHAFTFPNFS